MRSRISGGKVRRLIAGGVVCALSVRLPCNLGFGDLDGVKLKRVTLSIYLKIEATLKFENAFLTIFTRSATL